MKIIRKEDGQKVAYVQSNDLEFLFKIPEELYQEIFIEISDIVAKNKDLENEFNMGCDYIRFEDGNLVDFFDNTELLVDCKEIEDKSIDERILFMNKQIIEVNEKIENIKDYFGKPEDIKAKKDRIKFIQNHRYIDILMHRETDFNKLYINAVCRGYQKNKI